MPGNHQGDSAPPEPLRSRAAKNADPPGNEQLQEKARQIIAATPEVRPEKVAALQKAVAEGTYEVEARKVANALITELLLKR